MVIRNNGVALRSYRSYRMNNGSVNKNLEKLSTGYRINRSADDAAGLAISEKMRSQITGLEGAERNVKNGIGLIQTAEGALDEYHKILNRMLELGGESANGAYDDRTDRAQLQKELSALRQELTRIAESANFNGIYMLNHQGSEAQDEADEAILEAASLLDARLAEEGARGGKIQITLFWETREDLDLHCYTPENGGHIFYGNRDVEGGHLDIDAQAGQIMEKPVENIYFDNPKEGVYKVVVHNYSNTTVEKAVVRVKIGEQGRIYSVDLNSIQGRQYYNVTEFTYSEDPDKVVLLGGAPLPGSTPNPASAVDAFTSRIRLFIGETPEESNFLEVPVFDMRANAVELDNINIASQQSALTAVSKIKEVINHVSDVRGVYGAIQNRLEHAANYLSNSRENIQNAESVIRDADMVNEMMKYTKNSILMQSSRAMMSQANMLPESALDLIR